ncbi:MAG: hypothetical protein J5601_00950, partial [Elusimicrobiaceae bacterium]|nr:hypothetical protein [Elusimicrobiaceae bacterium]
YLYILSALFITAMGTFAPVKIWQLFSRFGQEALAMQKTLLVAGFCWFGLQLISYYLQAVAEMHKFFTTAWLGVLSALCPFLFLIIGGRHWGLLSMVYGFITANIIQIVILLYLLKVQLNWSFIPSYYPFSKKVKQNIATGQTLAIMDIVNSLLPLFLMSAMPGGIISALNYCKQLTDSPTEIITARICNVLKIELTEDATAKDKEKFVYNYLKTNYLILLILTPLVAFTVYFAYEIVALFFKRGAFTQTAAHHTVLFLRPMIVTLLLIGIGFVQNNAIAAARKVKESFPYTLTSALFTAALFAILLPCLGAFSYPYLITAGLIIGFIINYFFFRKHFPFLPYKQSLWEGIRLAAIGLCALVPAAVAAIFLPSIAWLRILVCGTIYMVGYVVLLHKAGDTFRITTYLFPQEK